jgi:hypothetical protein
VCGQHGPGRTCIGQGRNCGLDRGSESGRLASAKSFAFEGAIAPPSDLPALLKKLSDTYLLLPLELVGFDGLHRTLEELAQHPPPHTDAAAFWKHLAERIEEARKQIEKMRALLPSDMRIKK